MTRRRRWIAIGFTLTALTIGCQPKSPSEKAEDTMEDAAHETGQAVERAGEKVEDAAQ
jgi:hypothetical protein